MDAGERAVYPLSTAKLMRKKAKTAQARERIEVKRKARRLLHWQQRFIDLLGKVPDHVVASKAGISLTTVSKERRRRDIKAFQQSAPITEWADEMIALLGVASDAEVAAELDLAIHCVTYKRQMLRIPPYHPYRNSSPNRFSWTLEQIQLLGTISDKSVADQIGVSPTTVKRHRQRLGIEPFRIDSRRASWTEEILGLLGKVPDAEIRRRFGINCHSIGAKRRSLGIAPVKENQSVVATDDLKAILHLPGSVIARRTDLKLDTIRRLQKELGIKGQRLHDLHCLPETIARFGKDTDAEIARDIGCTARRISRLRRGLGIAAADQETRWTSDEVGILGTDTDRKIAKRLGRTIASVRSSRIFRSIPVFLPEER